MMKTLVYIINGLVCALYTLLTSSKILKRPINYKNKKFWICYIIESIYIMLSYSLTDSFIRVIVHFLLLSLLDVFLFEVEIVKGILSSFFSMLIIILAEILYVIVVISILKISEESFRQNFFISFAGNTTVSVFGFLIINIKIIYMSLNKAIENIKFNNDKSILIFSFLSISSLSILLYYVYFKVSFFQASMLCFLLIIIFTILTLYLFKEKNENIKLQLKYEIVSDNLQEYEKMYQFQRVINHEVKNELSSVRELANKNDKKLIGYLDKLIDVKFTKKEEWLDILKRIPEPTLRGLLYYKMSLMEHKEINGEIDLSKSVSVSDFQKISDELYKRICTVIGIYLDNAIQAVDGLENKNIRIEIYLDTDIKKELVIRIINNFKGEIDLEKINEAGYSSKGKGRGLGLSLAKETIEKEPKMTGQTEIIKNQFIQKLKIAL